MPGSKLLKEVADYCWSNKFLDVFRNFFKEHAEAFEGAPPMCGGEHDMKYYSLFQTYLKLYEDILEEYLQTIGVPVSDFYQEVREAQNETHDLYLSTFIDCLLASADYESFYKVMAREGSRVASLKAATRQDAKADTKPEKPESKASKASDLDAESKIPENADWEEVAEKKSHK